MWYQQQTLSRTFWLVALVFVFRAATGLPLDGFASEDTREKLNGKAVKAPFRSLYNVMRAAAAANEHLRNSLSIPDDQDPAGVKKHGLDIGLILRDEDHHGDDGHYPGDGHHHDYDTSTTTLTTTTEQSGQQHEATDMNPKLEMGVMVHVSEVWMSMINDINDRLYHLAKNMGALTENQMLLGERLIEVERVIGIREALTSSQPSGQSAPPASEDDLNLDMVHDFLDEAENNIDSAKALIEQDQDEMNARVSTGMQPSMAPNTLSTIAQSNPSTMAPHTPSTLAPNTPSTMAPHTPLTMASNTPSTKALHKPSTMASHNPSTFVPKTPSTMAPHNPPTMAPQRPLTLAPQNSATLTPSTLSSMVPSNQPTLTRNNQPTMAPHNPPTMARHNPSTLGQQNQQTLAPNNPPTMAPHKPSTLAPNTPSTIATQNQPTLAINNQPTMAPHNQPTMAPHNQPTMAPHNPSTLGQQNQQTLAPNNPPTMAPHRPTLAPNTPSTIAAQNQPTLATNNPPTMAPHNQPTMAPHIPSTFAPHSPTMATNNPPTLAPDKPLTMAPHHPSTLTPNPPLSMAPHNPSTMVPHINPVPTMAPRITSIQSQPETQPQPEIESPITDNTRTKPQQTASPPTKAETVPAVNTETPAAVGHRAVGLSGRYSFRGYNPFSGDRRNDLLSRLRVGLPHRQVSGWGPQPVLLRRRLPMERARIGQGRKKK